LAQTWAVAQFDGKLLKMTVKLKLMAIKQKLNTESVMVEKLNKLPPYIVVHVVGIHYD
jgi:hypothetical protein